MDYSNKIRRGFRMFVKNLFFIIISWVYMQYKNVMQGQNDCHPSANGDFFAVSRIYSPRALKITHTINEFINVSSNLCERCYVSRRKECLY